MKTARKYDLETGQYEDYVLPEGATCYEDDMNKKIACCECGKDQPSLFDYIGNRF